MANVHSAKNMEYLSAFSTNAGKYGPEKTPYLDTSHAVVFSVCIDSMIALLLNIPQLIVVEVTQKKVEPRPITPVNVSLWKFVFT